MARTPLYARGLDLMQLFLIRHAIAAPVDMDALAVHGPDAADAARPLTRRGRRHLDDVARGLDRLDLGLERLLHSPRLRAIETADRLARVLRCPTEVCAELAIPPDATLLARFTGSAVAAVGHMPHLADLARTLCGGDESWVAGFHWRRAGVLWLDGDPVPGGMRVRAVLPPRVFRRLA